MRHSTTVQLIDADHEWGELMRQARMQLGLSQDELAAKVGMDGASYAKLEKGRGRPRASTREKIENVIRELQAAIVEPRLIDLLQAIAKIDEAATAQGLIMPEDWPAVMERVNAELRAVDPSVRRVSQLKMARP